MREGPDEELARVNAISFAADVAWTRKRRSRLFLHASRLGLFEMSWNILCPSCGGVLDANATLKSVRQEDYHCAFCGVANEPTLDDTVEVSFTVSPRVRRIAAHDPDSLSFWDYYRQIFFGSGVAFPSRARFDELAQRPARGVELQAGERAILTLQLPAQPIIIFDPVTHTAHVIEVTGEPRGSARSSPSSSARPMLTSAVGHASRSCSACRSTTARKDGSARRLRGRACARGLLGGRRPFLTAKRLLTNQTFRDLYRTDTLEVDQRLKIMSLTFLFTDLKGSTELYERVGDLVAYDLVRAHFQILTRDRRVRIRGRRQDHRRCGDGDLPGAPSAVSAALRMREAMRS